MKFENPYFHEMDQPCYNCANLPQASSGDIKSVMTELMLVFLNINDNNRSAPTRRVERCRLSLG